MGLVFSCLLFTSQAHADGGAPNLAYVAGAQNGVGVVDIAQQKVTARFSTAEAPSVVLLSPDGSLLYVTQPAHSSVIALAARTGQMICQASFPGHPALLALNFDGTVLYVAGMDETTIMVLDAKTCLPQRSFQAPEPIFWLAVTVSSTGSALNTQIWTAGTTSVDVLDDQGGVVASISVPGGARFITLPGGLTAYVATRQGSILAIDMLTYHVFATLLRGGLFGSMDYNAVTGEIYVPDQNKNQIDVLAPVLSGSGLTTQEPAQVLSVGSSPQSIAITNDGQLGLVALSGGAVDLLDLPERSIAKIIPVGGSPHFIITGSYPPPNVPVPQIPQVSSPTILLIGLCVVLLFAGAVLAVSWLRRRSYKSSLPFLRPAKPLLP